MLRLSPIVMHKPPKSRPRTIHRPTEQELLAKYDLSGDRLIQHAFVWPEEFPPPKRTPLKEKLKRKVWAGKQLTAIKLPADANWLQRDGYEMQHCLQLLHNRYTQAIQCGDIDVYSLIDRKGRAVINIEVARKHGCGVPQPVTCPTLMQVRGFRNQCPPDDSLMPDLMSFLKSYGKNWATAERYRNFDGKPDAVLVRERWEQLRKNRGKKAIAMSERKA